MLHKVHFGEFLFTFNFIQRNIFFLLHSDTTPLLIYTTLWMQTKWAVDMCMCHALSC